MNYRLVASLVVVCCALVTAQPKIAVERLEFDLGIVYAGQVIKGGFGVKNIGDQPLVIRSIQPSCGCTTVKSPKPELKPGESDHIEIEFRSEGFRGDQMKYVSVISNDPSLENLTIRFKVLVKEELEPVNNSGLLFFRSVPIGTEQEQVCELRNTAARPLTVKGVRSAGESVRGVSDKKLLQPGESLRISIRVSPKKIGYASEKLYIDLDSKNQPHAVLSVTYIGTKE